MQTYEERLLDAYSGILTAQAEGYVNAITGTVIRMFQKAKRSSGMMTSEDDSGLANLWDEFCVQMQGEESFYFGAYKSFLYTCIEEILNTRYSQNEIKMLWLLTDAFEDWTDCEFLDEEELDDCFFNRFPESYSQDAVVEMLVQAVESAAGDSH